MSTVVRVVVHCSLLALMLIATTTHAQEGTRSIGDLIKALQSDKITDRFEALAALEKMETKPKVAIQALTKMTETEPNETLRMKARTLLESINGKNSPTTSRSKVDHLIQDLKSEKAGKRFEAASELAKLKLQASTAVSELEKAAMNDPDETVRMEAQRGLQIIRDAKKEIVDKLTAYKKEFYKAKSGNDQLNILLNMERELDFDVFSHAGETGKDTIMWLFGLYQKSYVRHGHTDAFTCVCARILVKCEKSDDLTLVSALRGGTHANFRVAAAHGLLSCCADYPERILLHKDKLLKPADNDADPLARLLATCIVTAVKPEGNRLKIVAGVLENKKSKWYELQACAYTLEIAAKLLSKSDRMEAIDRLIPLLSHDMSDTPAVALQAASAIESFGPDAKSAVGVLAKRLDENLRIADLDEDLQPRQQFFPLPFAKALLAINTKDALVSLVSCKKDAFERESPLWVNPKPDLLVRTQYIKRFSEWYEKQAAPVIQEKGIVP